MNHAPIALFAYNRPYHLKETLTALSKNFDADKSDLIIFLDGIADINNSVLVENCSRVEEIAKSVQGFKKVEIIQSGINKGCDQSEIDGITEVVNRYGKVIVLEDDLITSPFFLSYMNFCLNYFEEIENVGSINSFSFKIKGLSQYFFLKGGNPWGWATWDRAWSLYNDDSPTLLEKLKAHDLNDWEYGGSYDLLKNGTFWDIKWYTSLYIENKLGLFPSRSFVRQIGFDGSGTHYHPSSTNKRQYQLHELAQKVDYYSIQSLPIKENIKEKRIIQNYYFDMKGQPREFHKRMVKKYYFIKHQLKKLIMPHKL
jgi:hypothetical protein